MCHVGGVCLSTNDSTVFWTQLRRRDCVVCICVCVCVYTVNHDTVFYHKVMSSNENSLRIKNVSKYSRVCYFF